MQIKTAALFIMISPFLMGNQGCEPDDIPTTEQIEFYLPANFRTCPYAPNSPGAGASERQRAIYIQGLYYAWKRCYDNVGAVDELYSKYRARLHEVIKGEN